LFGGGGRLSAGGAPQAQDVAKFDATARACALVGWEYRLLGATDALVTANLRWLAGYRHPRHRLPEIAQLLRHAFSTPTSLLAGGQAAGDPIAVLPVLSLLVMIFIRLMFTVQSGTIVVENDCH
jgi:hypothetical protein